MVQSWKDLTAEQYLKIMDTKDTKELVSIVYGKDANSIPVSYYSNGALDFLQEDPAKTDVLTFKSGDKVYKLTHLDKMSMGEYIDVTTFAENWKDNIFKIMCVLYRPMKGLNWKHKLKMWWGKKAFEGGAILGNGKIMALGARILHNMDYTLETYDSEIHLKNEDDFKSMSANQFHSFVLFFSLVLTTRIPGILKSTQSKSKEKKVSPKKPRQNSPSKAGGGTTSSKRSRTPKSGSKTKS